MVTSIVHLLCLIYSPSWTRVTTAIVVMVFLFNFSSSMFTAICFRHPVLFCYCFFVLALRVLPPWLYNRKYVCIYSFVGGNWGPGCFKLRGPTGPRGCLEHLCARYVVTTAPRTKLFILAALCPFIPVTPATACREAFYYPKLRGSVWTSSFSTFIGCMQCHKNFPYENLTRLKIDRGKTSQPRG